jgi:hypothetical protein
MNVLKPLVFAMIGAALLCVPSFAQEQTKPDEPKIENPAAIPPTTGCEGITGALPEAISECQKRETARLFIILGKPAAAVKVLCTTKSARDAFGGSTEACIKSN